MYTNNFFQPARMSLYLKKHITEQYKYYLLAALAATGAIVAILVFAVFVTNARFQSTSNLIPFYYIGLIMGGALMAGQAFSEFSSKERSIDFFMLPASQFEKYLTVFLFTPIGYFVFFHLGWFMTLWLIDVIQGLKYSNFKLAHNYNYTSDYKYYWYIGYIFLQSVILLGSTYFHKLTLIKAVLSLLAVLIVTGLVHCFIILCLFGTEGHMYRQTLPFVLVGKQIYGPYSSSYTEIYLIPEWLQNTYLFIIRFLLTPCVLIIAYFRLKDKEI